MPMAQRRRHIKRVLLPLTAAGILWLVSVTAASHNLSSALTALSHETDTALTILRLHLGDRLGESGLPDAVSLVISQSPLLLSGQSAVQELRRRAETEDVSAPGAATEDVSPPSAEEESPPAAVTVPVEETAIVIVDNGVRARTLVPSSEKGYLLTGDVYIDNRSEKSFDASLFDGSFAAKLTGSSEPEVLIVHTHGSEAYTMPAGQEYVPSGDCRTTDENFSVVRVGEEIANTLRKAGISVLHATELHDYPEYSGAYNRSLDTVEEYLERYPSLSLVLDVHRDAVSDSNGTAYKVVSSASEGSIAQMSFVIGTDGGGLTHPDWQENLKLAAALQQTLCDRSPTVMRPITVRNSRYNQHTTTGSLLVEMGAAGNSLEEALLSARLLGQAIADTMLTVEPSGDVPGNAPSDAAE